MFPQDCGCDPVPALPAKGCVFGLSYCSRKHLLIVAISLQISCIGLHTAVLQHCLCNGPLWSSVEQCRPLMEAGCVLALKYGGR